MCTSAFTRRSVLLTLFPILGTALLVLGNPGMSAQDSGKKPPREEEEVGPLKPRRTSPLRVEDDDPIPKKPRADTGAPAAVDLAAEAERTRNQFVRDLFKSLAVPHDRLIFTSPPRTDLVEPLRGKFIVLKPGRSVFVEARRFNDRFELDGTKFSGSLTKDHGIVWYEQYAIDRVEEFLKRPLDKEPPSSRNFLSRAGMQREAERALTAVVRFHESARERGVRDGFEWDELEKRLRHKLRDVQLEQLRLLVEARDWEAAAGAAAHLVRSYPDDPKVQEVLPGLLVRQAEQALREQDYYGARLHVERLQDQFPKSKAVDPVRASLQQKSSQLLAEVEKLLEQGNKQEAAKRLEEARRIWPYATELRSERFRPLSDASILYVGVRSLPQLLSPATACTDVEKQALELIFEGLMRYQLHTPGGPRYEPVLAADMPRLTPLGRVFEIHRQAWWSDGSRVSAPDVRYTLNRLLLDKSGRGRQLAWAELFDPRNAVTINDAFHVKLTLGQGYLDPLSLMTFKVLPQSRNLTHADDPDFARRPVGSGPYKYEGVNPEKHAVFAANPFYKPRREDRALPRFSEIHFYQSAKPAEDFTNGKLHLLLDPPASVVQQLREAGAPGLRFPKFRNRRVWFLAVNHRRGGLEDVRLRRALTLAINREQILDDCFRSGFADLHRPLNGPYLPDTWAYSPQSGAADPFKPDLAKGLAQEALRERTGGQKLTLRYPAGDEAARRACQQIAQQVKEMKTGLEIVPQERTPAELRQDVERDFHYDLAYYSWDYPDHTFWLWPLFAPRDGENLFRYRIDPELEAAFRELLTHREFARVQELTHKIHTRFQEDMPFIPLWQLDTQLVVHPHLGLPPGLDAQAVFSDVDQWKLEKR